jgi:hypothetical protein
MTEPQHNVEFYKAYIEYLKHLTTLSTGSIILIATFLEKLFAQPIWKFAVFISLSGFMLSVLSSVIAYTLIVYFEFPGSPIEKSPGWVVNLGGTGVLFTWIGFLIGILSLATFALRNICD